MRKLFIFNSVFSLALISFFVLVNVVEAAGLVPCGNQGIPECTLCHLVALSQRVLNFMVLATVLVASLMFLYAGVLYIFSSANPGNVSKGHKTFSSALIGMLIVLCAWLIINVFMVYLFQDSDMARRHGIQIQNWGRIICPP